MKIIIADFEISKYGGIVEHVESKVLAFKHLGHEVDIVQMSPSSVKQKAYDKSIVEFESGTYGSKQKINSQNGGYEKSSATGYWKNNYYGYYLPPSNKIGVFETDAVERWNNIVEDVDLVIWNFAPTKSSAWAAKDFSFWWKFFDLPSQIKQVFVVHDAYFDVRASNITALKEKILYLECAHIAAYKCCENIGIPRALLLNPRYLEEGLKMPIKPMGKRKIDFFAAHIFKSMKHIEELIRAVPYINEEWVGNFPDEQYFPYTVQIAGSGIEQAYMVAKEKIKSCYICNLKTDPDLPKGWEVISNWDRAEGHGMEYLGQISGVEVGERLRNAKFAVDPSWAKHYAQYCNTHINGFIIEAMLNGCYPVLRDYRGLTDYENVYDPLFEEIRAVVIPWDATPKQFAEYLKKANIQITPAQYLKDTLHNFGVVMELFNAVKNAEQTIRFVKGGNKLVSKELPLGKDSDTVKKVTSEIMEDFYHIKLPIEWETE